ncbi:MAG: efflux transporter outer membrane subunit [bacterium]
MAVLVLCSSCPEPKKKPDVDVPQKFSESGPASMPEKWWTSFSDPELDRLEERAMSGNLDVLAAWDRLDQAEAMYRSASAGLWPSISASLSLTDKEMMGEKESTKTAPSSGGMPSGGAQTSTDGTTYSGSLTASYELDLWGRVRSSRKAAKADFRAGREDLYTMAMTVSSQVAMTWYELVEQKLQLGVLKEQEQINKDYLELQTLRYRQGVAAAADVVQQRQQLEATRSEMPNVQKRIQTLKHQLAVLIGKPPRTKIEAERDSLPGLPPLPDTGIPADVLMQRPDVRSAKKRLEAAGYRVDEAFASRLPSISISLSASDTEEEIESLFENWLRNLTVNLAAPLLDAGRRKAEEERARAAASQRVHAFEKTMLTALREVEDALARERNQHEYIKRLEKQMQSARQSLELARERYRNGATGYLPVLVNLKNLQALERQHLTARRILITYRIALYRALAGSWDLERKTEKPEATQILQSR